MAALAEPLPAKPSWGETIAALADRRVFTMLLLGFASGLPFLLSVGTLGVWLTTAEIDIKTIGLMSLANFAYSFKFLWAPLVDNLRLPGLHPLLGRRRSWMLLSQIGIIAALVGIAGCDPRTDLETMALFAICLAFASSVQDIAIDAWRIEVMPPEKQPLMAGVTTLGYRLGLLAGGAGVLFLATRPSWGGAYVAMAAAMSVGIIGALIARRTPETPDRVAGDETVAEATAKTGLTGWPARLVQGAYRFFVAPFVDFFARHGVLTALVILAVIAFYSLPDRVMGVMASPFYIRQGFTTDEIAIVSKTYGVWIGIAGAVLGGLAAARLGTRLTILLGCTLGAASNLAFAWLATQGHDVTAFVIAITFENALGGFSGVALVAFISSLTNVAFSGTQYALFSSFAALPGKFAGASSGYLVEALGGFYGFFIATAAMGIPAILLVVLLMRLQAAAPQAADAEADV